MTIGDRSARSENVRTIVIREHRRKGKDALGCRSSPLAPEAADLRQRSLARFRTIDVRLVFRCARQSLGQEDAM